MNSLVLAQGATHVTEDRLRKVVEKINHERVYYRTDPSAIDDIWDLAEYEYGCNIRDFGIIPSLRSYAVEEKYDGYSYLNSFGRFYSKSLSTAKATKGMPVDKTGHVPHLASICRYVYEQCGADLHGELYIMGGTSDDVTKILGCTEDKAIRRQMNGNQLHYMLIDIRAINGKSLINEPHKVRRAILTYVYEKYIAPMDPENYIMLTREFPTEDPCEVFKAIVNRGGEGIMIKDENGLYVPGKKPVGNWIKGKKKITHDVFITGLNEGTGKNIGLFGSFRFSQMIDGKAVECGSCSSGLSDEMREYIYHNADSMIANKQVFEIEAIQESVKSFRNAVFLRLRDDKDYTECTPEMIRVKENLI